MGKRRGEERLSLNHRMRGCQVRARRLISKSTMSTQKVEQIWEGEGMHMRKGWTYCGLKNNAIKIMALPKIPGAIFRGDIFLQKTVKIGFHFQEKLEFSTIFTFF